MSIDSTCTILSDGSYLSMIYNFSLCCRCPTGSVYFHNFRFGRQRKHLPNHRPYIISKLITHSRNKPCFACWDFKVYTITLSKRHQHIGTELSIKAIYGLMLTAAMILTCSNHPIDTQDNNNSVNLGLERNNGKLYGCQWWIVNVNSSSSLSWRDSTFPNHF